LSGHNNFTCKIGGGGGGGGEGISLNNFAPQEFLFTL
jgi:hypothetical protein